MCIFYLEERKAKTRFVFHFLTTESIAYFLVCSYVRVSINVSAIKSRLVSCVVTSRSKTGQNKRGRRADRTLAVSHFGVSSITVPTKGRQNIHFEIFTNSN